MKDEPISDFFEYVTSEVPKVTEQEDTARADIVASGEIKPIKDLLDGGTL